MKCRKQGYWNRQLTEPAARMVGTWSFPQFHSHVMTWQASKGVAGLSVRKWCSLGFTKYWLTAAFIESFSFSEHSGYLTHILLTWTIWRAPTNASKWRMGFNSAFKGLHNLFQNWITEDDGSGGNESDLHSEGVWSESWPVYRIFPTQLKPIK